MKKELESGKLLQPKVENRLLVLRCEFTLHTLIHTFPLENEPQYLGLSIENAGVFGSAFFFSTSWAEASGGESMN